MISIPTFQSIVAKKKKSSSLSVSSFIPPIISGLLMQIDVNRPSSVWTDTTRTSPASVGNSVRGVTEFSGNNNHWSQATAVVAPTVQTSAGGKLVLRFAGSGTWYMLFASQMTTIRTVYWVANEDPAWGGAYQFLLGHSSNYQFHGDNPHGCFLSGTANVGLLHIDKTNVGIGTARPTTLKTITAQTNSDSTATEFSRDRNNAFGNRSWVGDLALLLVYSGVHTTQNMSDTEDAIKSYLSI